MCQCKDGHLRQTGGHPASVTGGHGHVFVGANVPFGMVQLGPTSVPQEWDWTSGYHASDSTVIGFSHTHLSGTGIGDLFDITVMPVVGKSVYERGKEDNPKRDFGRMLIAPKKFLSQDITVFPLRATAFWQN